MNGFPQVCITRQCLEGGRIIGLQQIPHIQRWRIKLGELEPGQLVLHVTPDPRNGVQLWAVRREPYRLHIGRPAQALRGVGAAVIQEQAVAAVGERVGEGVHNDLERVGIQVGKLQKAALARGWSHGPIDVEPREGVLDQPHGLDATGGEPPSAHGQHAQATFVLTAHPEGAGVVGRDAVLQPLVTRRLKRGHGLRGFLGDWAARPCAWC
jgi:hypothetical protein